MQSVFYMWSLDKRVSDFSTPLVSHMLNHNGCQLGTVGVLVWPIDYVHGDL